MSTYLRVYLASYQCRWLPGLVYSFILDVYATCQLPEDPDERDFIFKPNMFTYILVYPTQLLFFFYFIQSNHKDS